MQLLASVERVALAYCQLSLIEAAEKPEIEAWLWSNDPAAVARRRELGLSGSRSGTRPTGTLVRGEVQGENFTWRAIRNTLQVSPAEVLHQAQNVANANVQKVRTH